MESRSPTPTPPVLEPEVSMPTLVPEAAPKEQVSEAAVEAAGDNDEEAGDEAGEAEVEEEEAVQYIPRLLDAAGNVTPRSRDQNLEPSEWSVQNVTSFLEVSRQSTRAFFLLKAPTMASTIINL